MIIENTPVIETERLILRKFEIADTKAAFDIFSDEEVNKFLPWFTVKTFAQAQSFLQNNFFKFYEKEHAYNYAIALKTDNKAIGYINVHDIGKSNDFGYGLKKELWHMGIATEACHAVINRLKQNGFYFITATHDVNNKNSGEVMKKLGMVYKYSYKEQWQPKDILVTFRMYQLNFDGNNQRTYMEYWNKYKNHWV